MGAAGTAGNVVPATAHLLVDVRVAEPDEADRIDHDLHALAATVPGTSIALSGGPNRPPLPPSSGRALHAQAAAIGERLGLGRLDAISVGGGSDGNFTAAVGCPTLDGLGAVGAGAHAEGEWVSIPAMAERAALLADLLDALRDEA